MVQHLRRLKSAGLTTERFFDALSGIRDDRSLPPPQREALLRLIAIECYVWYLEALRGAPIDRAKLTEEAQRLREEHAVAIKRSPALDPSVELLSRDIGRSAPKDPPER